jgi:glycosyltransferase involved in cell wall biosynthesis
MPQKNFQVALCLPSRNEWQSLQKLLPEIAALKGKWESVDLDVIVFDDGSSDGTFTHLRDYATADFHLSVLRSASSLGKTPALAAAFRYAREAGAEYIFMMDADGQDDPRYLPEMLEKLISGAEVVNGRRSNRKHSFFKRQSSRLFNGLVRAITGLSLLDVNSGLKGFTREVAEYLDGYLYGELHRVLLVVASFAGFRIDEVRVVNRPRSAGATKYGLTRGWRGILDLLTLQALRRYQSRPGHLFSASGFSFLVGGASAAAGGALLFPAVADSTVGWFAVVLISLGVGVVLLGLGFLAELLLFLSRNPRNRLEEIVGHHSRMVSGDHDSCPQGQSKA